MMLHWAAPEKHLQEVVKNDSSCWTSVQTKAQQDIQLQQKMFPPLGYQGFPET